MVIAEGHDHTAVLGGAREISVLERIAGTIDPRSLAVPKREHAIVVALVAEQTDLLGAPDGGRGEVFVQALLKFHLG